MSTIIMSACWPIQGISASQKSVLISLADNANDEGVCWPSVAKISMRTCLSERAVQAAIKALIEASLLNRQERHGRSSYFTITPAAYAPPQQLHPAATAPTPADPAPQPPQELHPTPADPAPRTINEPSVEPSKNPKDISRAKKSSAGERIPDDWKPSQADADFALTTFPHWTPAHLELVAGGFKDHWMAKPGNDAKKLDWSATWRTWVRNEERYRPFAGSPGRMTPNRPSFAQQRAQAEIDAFVNGPADDKTIEMEVPRVGF